MTHHLAILAYGSLLADPGPELGPHIITRSPAETPFEVEYARTSSNRAGAPTLVCVPDGKGGRVSAQLLVLEDSVYLQEAIHMLYRREVHRVGETHVTYDHDAQLRKENGVLIQELRDVEGISRVIYADLQPNLDFIFDGIPAGEKATKLAELAVESVTEDTFPEKKDGIQYLDDAIRYSIRTPLTDSYRKAILRLAAGAPDLLMARQFVARQKSLIEEGD